MKLSDYAKRVGVTYKTVWQWWKDGRLDAYQLPAGTIIVREPTQASVPGIALYAPSCARVKTENKTEVG